MEHLRATRIHPHEPFHEADGETYCLYDGCSWASHPPSVLLAYAICGCAVFGAEEPPTEEEPCNSVP